MSLSGGSEFQEDIFQCAIRTGLGLQFAHLAKGDESAPGNNADPVGDILGQLAMRCAGENPEFGYAFHESLSTIPSKQQPTHAGNRESPHFIEKNEVPNEQALFSKSISTAE